MENIPIGEKIKNLRTSQNLTLKQLSEQTNLSTGFLSQLERGLSSIAVDSLEIIAKVLNVSLTTFFDNQTVSPSGPIIHSFEQQYNQTAAKIFQTVLNQDTSLYQMLPRVILLMPLANVEDESEEIELYHHNGEELIYVLEGTVTLVLNSQKHILHPGDSIHLDSNCKHNWMNNTNKIVKLLTVNYPSPFFEKNSEFV